MLVSASVQPSSTNTYSFIWETIDSNIAFDTTSKITHEKHWNDFHFRIFDCCSSIWLSVKDVLCNDSPEGHLPEDLDEVPNIDTKDVLSYSFRAVHESRYISHAIDFSPLLTLSQQFDENSHQQNQGQKARWNKDSPYRSVYQYRESNVRPTFKS